MRGEVLRLRHALTQNDKDYLLAFTLNYYPWHAHCSFPVYMTEGYYDTLRARMVEEQLRQREIFDQRILKAMEEVPRHRFVPEESRLSAYEDRPLPIGQGQTISQPYIVALMLQTLELTGNENVLEVGTGSGYQAALLGRLVKHVYTVEIIAELADTARALLKELQFDNVEVVAANGSIGWKAGAPYDAIIVAAASPLVPQSLIEQLQDGGRLVLPVGALYEQRLLRIRKHGKEVRTEDLGSCAFVPLIGAEGWKSGAHAS